MVRSNSGGMQALELVDVPYGKAFAHLKRALTVGLNHEGAQARLIKYLKPLPLPELQNFLQTRRSACSPIPKPAYSGFAA